MKDAPQRPSEENYRWMLGPEAIAKIEHPTEDMALVDGAMVPLKEALIKIVAMVSKAKKPVMVVPARKILWYEEGAPKGHAKAIRSLAAAMGAEIRPIYDKRPAYPMARTACEINPYHGDLVIAHENYDVAVFYGVECSYADVALKIIALGTNCYRMALCGHFGHVDANITLRDTDLARLKELTAMFHENRLLAR
ncbi:MAG: hypothetical protein DDT34_00360 [Firmicutes bacterium]|nr:hypothetical protein [Bacillota bacterium]MBT9156338.1 hypothetical protein [candidate division NPL-UPA2 bacterium]